MSKFEWINAFITVVEHNGFAAASRKLNLSTAAISRQVTALEAALGVELLKRTTRQLSLTEIGADYFQQCKKTMTELQEMELTISGSKRIATGTLRIMSNRYFGIKTILPRLSQFMAKNPKLAVNVELAERFPNLAEEGIDIMFGYSIEGPPELVRKRIATTRYVLCASPRYLKKHGAPKLPSELTGHQYITHTMRKPDNAIMLKDGKQILIKPTLWLNDSYAMRECAIHDMGIVNLHDYIVTDAIKNGKLVEILKHYQAPQKNVYLYYQQSRYLQPKIRQFIDFYCQE